MKRKIGTAVEDDLLRRAKVLAAAQGKPLSQVLENALREYLERRRGPGSESAVTTTWGVMQADPSLIEAIMEDEGVLDA